MRYPRILLLVASWWWAGAALAAGAAGPELDISFGVKIPLRDGVKLAATVYRPHGQVEPLPVLFTLTPYIADNYHDRAVYFARHGYVFVLVDVRGRGSSEGEFLPMEQEAKDGHDVVEWLARQPYANGKVAMWGGSYAGYNQWATAKERPAHLATIVPAAAAHPGVDFPFSDNIFYPYIAQWLTFTSGKTPNTKLFDESSYWASKFRGLHQEGRPFAELASLVGNDSPHFHRWLAHPQPDHFWDAMVPTQEQYAALQLPILTITGHYDGDQPGAFAFYRNHHRFGSPEALAKHFLIVGPWDHAGTRTPQLEVGGLSFGAASQLDLNELHRQWYDWTMKDGPRPEFLKARVAYFVPPTNEWKYADSLEGIGAEMRTLYLASDGGANDPFRAGDLLPSAEEVAEGAPLDTYTYDPRDTRYGALEPEDDPRALVSQTAVMRLDGVGLVYHTAPFPEPTEITGWPRLTAWMELDVPDIDFQADLYELLPDGTSVFLSTDQLRARYRESVRQARPVPAGEALPYTFDSWFFFSRQVAAGSRLRLVLHSPRSIFVQRNYCSGGEVAKETAAVARTAHVRLLHDLEHPSRLELPVVPVVPAKAP